MSFAVGVSGGVRVATTRNLALAVAEVRMHLRPNVSCWIVEPSRSPAIAGAMVIVHQDLSVHPEGPRSAELAQRVERLLNAVR